MLGVHEFAGECDRRVDIDAIVAVWFTDIAFARTHDFVVRIQVKSLVVLKHGDGVAGSIEDEKAERGCISVLADAFPGAVERRDGRRRRPIGRSCGEGNPAGSKRLKGSEGEVLRYAMDLQDPGTFDGRPQS